MKTKLFIIFSILFGCAGDTFAQTIIPFPDLINGGWNTEMSHLDGRVVSGSLAKSDGIISVAARVEVPTSAPGQRAFIQSLDLGTGAKMPISQIPGLHNHGVKPTTIQVTGNTVRVLTQSFDGPPVTPQNPTVFVTQHVRMYSVDPVTNVEQSDYVYMFDSMAVPVDFMTVDGTDIVLCNSIVNPFCINPSIYLAKTNTGSGHPVWTQTINTTSTPGNLTQEYASCMYLDEIANTIWVGIHTYDTTGEHGRVAKVSGFDGTLLWSCSTDWKNVSKILSPADKLVIIGLKQDDDGMYPVVAEIQDGLMHQEVILPIRGGEVLDAVTTDDEGCVLVGIQGEHGFIVKLDKMAGIEWISYPEMPVHDVLTTSESEYVFLLKDTESIWVVKTGAEVSISEHAENVLKIAQQNGIVTLGGDFAEAKLFDVSGRLIQTISSNVSQFEPVMTSGMYIVNVLIEQKQFTQKVIVIN